MGLTADRLKGGGLTSQRLAQQKEPGFIQGVVQSAVSPIAKTAAGVAGIGEAAIGLGTAGVGSLIGSERLKEAGLQVAGQQTQPKDFGYLGKASPVGYDESGQKLSYLQGLAQAFGVGTEIASNLVTGTGVAKAGTLAFKESFKQGVKESAKTGFKSGTLIGLGKTLQEQSVRPEDSVAESSFKVALDVLGTGVLGGVTSGVLAGTTAVGAAGVRRVVELVHPAFKEARIMQLVKNNADEIRKALNLNRTQRAIETRSGKDVAQFLSEEDLIPNVDGGKLDATEIIEAIEIKASAENSSFNKLLDDSGSFVALNKMRSKALSLVRGFGSTVANEVKDIEDEFLVLSQQFRDAPKDADGNLLIPSSVANNIKQFFFQQGKYNRAATPEQASKAASFRRLGTAFKELIEDSIEDADVRAFNMRLGDLQNAIYMLSERNGMPVQGGRLGKMIMRLTGAVAGLPVGPGGSIVGALSADKIADLLQDPRITTLAARQYIKLLKEEGKEELADQVKMILERRAIERGGRALLPEPSFIPAQEFRGGESGISKPLTEDLTKQIEEQSAINTKKALQQKKY